LISLLLAARDENGRQLTDGEIRDDAMAILVAGHETTAYSLAFAFYLLARHPMIYNKLQREVQEVLQGRPPKYDDLANLPYTVQVFKETLRLFPAAHTLPRQATQDTTIGDFTVKKGWFVGVDIWGMHRRSDYFPSPGRFDPDRFIPEREAQIPRNAYLPFGSGPRNCIGRGLAMMEGPLALAALTQHARLELEPSSRLKLKFLLTIRPRTPLMMKVHRL
jgi:cytochrome P450